MFAPIELNGVRYGVSLCANRWFPETVRCLELPGADVVVTASAGGDISREALREYLLTARVDFICPHRPRTAQSPGQTEAMTREYRKWMKEYGRTRFITEKLKLKINSSKSAVARPRERKFLSFSFPNGKEPKRRIAPKALDRFKARIRELTRQARGQSLRQMVVPLGVYLRGWRGYFGVCQTPSVLRALDEWIRRRLRCLVLRHWRTGRRKYAELVKRGVGRDLAAQTSGSSHGPWRLARSPALSIALPNAFWDWLGIEHVAGMR
ncbi:MAG: hypothetical protein NTU53_20960 [Planctomycetota bacterium]|nr:hypothetical protein [Planctomycetota bacterium]